MFFIIFAHVKSQHPAHIKPSHLARSEPPREHFFTVRRLTFTRAQICTALNISTVQTIISAACAILFRNSHNTHLPFEQRYFLALTMFLTARAILFTVRTMILSRANNAPHHSHNSNFPLVQRSFYPTRTTNYAHASAHANSPVRKKYKNGDKK